MNPSSPVGGPWRLLILDASDPADPRWLLATVTLADDTRPARIEPGGRRYADWPEVTAWVRQRVGREHIAIVPIAAMTWRIHEGGQPVTDDPGVTCAGCGAIIGAGREVRDGDGYDGLCGNCADRAESEGRWGP